MRGIAIGRIVGLLIAMIAMALSICCARECVQRNAEFHQWINARPMELSVDFSKPTEMAAPLRQTCGTSHGESLYFEVTPSLEGQGKPEELLKELSARVVIKDEDGNVIRSAKIDATTIHQYGPEEEIILSGFGPFPTGDYVATIHVESGVPALAGREQLVFVKYELCGLEQFPAWIAGAFSFGALVIGVVAAVCVLPGLLRHGFKAGG